MVLLKRFHGVEMDSAKKVLNSRYLLWMILAIPFIFLGNAWRTNSMIYGELVHATGELSARLLIITMAITPIRLMFPKARWPNWLLLRRRYFGVAAFFYAMFHTVVYVDRKQSLELIIKEGMEFSMWTGWIALLLFIVLAITSNDASVRILKRTWKKLHRWVYPVALMTFVHWIFIAYDFIPGLLHFLVLLFLESFRLWKRNQMKSNAN